MSAGKPPSSTGRRPPADGTDTEILNWLDDHSRYALSLTVHTPVTGDDVVATFGAVTEHYTVPADIR